jgi:signal transduction histidine kinase
MTCQIHRSSNMFKNLPTGTKLFILCATFLISIAVPIYGLVSEKRIAIDFSRKELLGSRYLGTVREIYSAVLRAGGTKPVAGGSHPHFIRALALAEERSEGRLQTAELASAFAAALNELWSKEQQAAERGSLMLSALYKGQALATRIGDDSNLALDPDLDTYYLQSIVVRGLPTFLARLAELQDFFATSVTTAEPSAVRDVRLSALAGLVRSTAMELKENLEAAYRGNSDGHLKLAIDAKFAALIASIDPYLAVPMASAAGIGATDAVASARFHGTTVEHAIEAWTAAQAELDRLLHVRIDGMLAKMLVGLLLIGTFAGLSIIIAVLTHRHIVQPLKRLETVASKVRSTKDYNLRAEHSSKDEIGRVTAAFNDMLAELAAARARETAERVAFAQATRLTTMGEMAASIAHEVNQPLAAIVANANAGLRWLSNATPDLSKVQAILQRVVRDGHRASEVIGSVRALIKRDVQQKAPLEINMLIEDVVGLLQSDIESEQIALKLELSSAGSSVLGDRVQLQQVILNLITNAIEAMRGSQDFPRSLAVRTARGEPHSVLVAVEDSGTGIDAKDRDRIFHPFFTTKPRGMGLGLSICRSIIEAHGGRLWAAPGQPRGTVLHFSLPAYNAGRS